MDTSFGPKLAEENWEIPSAPPWVGLPPRHVHCRLGLRLPNMLFEKCTLQLDERHIALGFLRSRGELCSRNIWFG